MEIGVNNYKCILDFSGIRNYLEDLLAKEQKSLEEQKRPSLKSIFAHRGQRLKETLEQLDERYPSAKDYFETLTRGSILTKEDGFLM